MNIVMGLRRLLGKAHTLSFLTVEHLNHIKPTFSSSWLTCPSQGWTEYQILIDFVHFILATHTSKACKQQHDITLYKGRKIVLPAVIHLMKHFLAGGRKAFKQL